MHQHYQKQKSTVNVTEDKKFYNNKQHMLIKKNILTVSLLRIVSLFECLQNHTI